MGECAYDLENFGPRPSRPIAHDQRGRGDRIRAPLRPTARSHRPGRGTQLGLRRDGHRRMALARTGSPQGDTLRCRSTPIDARMSEGKTDRGRCRRGPPAEAAERPGARAAAGPTQGSPAARRAARSIASLAAAGSSDGQATSAASTRHGSRTRPSVGGSTSPAGGGRPGHGVQVWADGFVPRARLRRWQRSDRAVAGLGRGPVQLRRGRDAGRGHRGDLRGADGDGEMAHTVQADFE